MTENGFMDHGILDEKHVKWHEDKVDANNDLTFGDAAVEGDWRSNHKKLSELIETDQTDLVQSIESLVVDDDKTTEYDDPAIVSLQTATPNKLSRSQGGWPTLTGPAPSIPQDIWGTPQLPTPQPAAPIQPPPGFGAPPGFNSGPIRPDQGDGLRSSLLVDSSMLSVEDLERQHLQRKVIESQNNLPAENGLRHPTSNVSSGMPSSRQTEPNPMDDPAVLATRLEPENPPVQAQNHVPNPAQLHPQHRQMLRNNQKQNNRKQNNQRKPRDPYANLMSKREREWITSMQLRALEIKDPEVDDYYYVNYMKRLLKKGQALENQLVTPAPKETRRNRRNSEKGEKNEEKKDEKEKEPKKGWSEGSLGKPISSSVHNPRRMIAMITKEPDVNSTPTDENTETELAKYMSKKNLFKSIEAAYTVLLDLELMVQEELRSFGKEAKKIEELLALIEPEDQMRLLSILSIRKGKRLVQRILPHLNQDSSIQILNCFINNLALITKRDIEDDVLPELYDVLSNIVNSLDFEQVADLATRKRYNNLSNVAKSRFGASIICKLLDRGQVLLSQMSIQEFPADARQAWLDLVKTLTRDIAAVALSAEGLPPLLGVYPSLAKAFERSRSQKHLINHLNGNYKKNQNNYNF